MSNDMNQTSSLPDIDNIIYSTGQPVVAVFVPGNKRLLAKLFGKVKMLSINFDPV